MDADNPGFYHLVSRCVRRVWLCGVDSQTGRSFEHRRGWIEDRVFQLLEFFSVELFAYAIMSNHYHLIVRFDPVSPRSWSDELVAEKWVRLTRGRGHVDDATLIASIAADPKKAQIYRERLGSLSWFMRFLNEPIARRANKEDDCTGRFWEGRFKSQVLLDVPAVVAGMVYVDLNPIRAGAAKTVQSSLYTSGRRRLESAKDKAVAESSVSGIDSPEGDGTKLSLSIAQYLNVLSGTAVRLAVSVGAEPPESDCSSPYVEWLHLVRANRNRHRRAFGSRAAVAAYAKSVGRRWLKGCHDPDFQTAPEQLRSLTRG